MFQADLLQDKVILVTGGGTGLGRAMGERFLELGAKVAICGRRQEVAEQAAADMACRSGGETFATRCDVLNAINTLPASRHVTSSGMGGCTLRTMRAPPQAARKSSATRAPTATYASSGKPARSPAPRCSTTSSFDLTNRATLSGVSATRFSRAAVSFSTAICIKL